MKTLSLKILLLFILLATKVELYSQAFIDQATPENAIPFNTSLTNKWTLEFSDEFNGTEVNTSKWTIDNSTKSRAARPSIGISDWRWKPENVSVTNGNLVLKVYKTGANAMTNGSVNSYNKYLTQYGYFEARIKIGDASKGTHTAFWMQGPNQGNVDGTANDGAEIDIFESAWTGEFTKSVVHIDGYGESHQSNTKQYSTPAIHDGFHVWGFHWTENAMDIYYDGVFKVSYSDPKWVVKSPEFLWLSNGASFGLTGNQYFIDYPVGYLTETQVDYIRVWKDKSATEVNDSLINRSKWELIKVDSEDTYGNNLVIKAFDNNPYSFWHTEWKDNQPEHPHEIQIALGDTAKIYGFKYLPRQDNNSNGTIANYDFYTSLDKNNWGLPKKSGTFSTNDSEKSCMLSDSVICRYIRLVAKSEINGNSFTSIAELNVMGDYLVDNGNVTTSFDEKLTSEIVMSVYPNPVKGSVFQINVKKLSAKDGIVTILDMQGRTIFMDKINEGINTIHLKNNLSNGVYLVNIIAGSQMMSKQLLISPEGLNY